MFGQCCEPGEEPQAATHICQYSHKGKKENIFCGGWAEAKHPMVRLGGVFIKSQIGCGFLEGFLPCPKFLCACLFHGLWWVGFGQICSMAISVQVIKQ